MYYMFLGKMQIPIPPPKLTMKVKNKNKTIQLMDKGEINIVKPVGLTEFSMDLLIPNEKYHFNQSLFKGFFNASYYLKQFKRMKLSKKPVRFIVVRMKQSGQLLHNTNIAVTIEDYSVQESADDGVDCIVKLRLKQFRPYGTKKIRVEVGENGENIGYIEQTRASDKIIPRSIKSNGSSLFEQVKLATGSGLMYGKIAKLNKKVLPFAVKVGEVINLE